MEIVNKTKDTGMGTDGFFVVDNNGNLTEKANIVVDSENVHMYTLYNHPFSLQDFYTAVTDELKELNNGMPGAYCENWDSARYDSVRGNLICGCLENGRVQLPTTTQEVTYTVAPFVYSGVDKGFLYNSTGDYYYSSHNPGTSTGFSGSIISFNNSSSSSKKILIRIRSINADINYWDSDDAYIAFSDFNVSMDDFINFSSRSVYPDKTIYSTAGIPLNVDSYYYQDFVIEVPSGESSMCVFSRDYPASNHPIQGEIRFQIIQNSSVEIKRPFYLPVFVMQSYALSSSDLDKSFYFAIYKNKDEQKIDYRHYQNKKTYPILQDGHQATSILAGMYIFYFDGGRFHFNSDGSIPNIATSSSGSSNIDMRLDTVTNTLYITDDGTPA